MNVVPKGRRGEGAPSDKTNLKQLSETKSRFDGGQQKWINSLTHALRNSAKVPLDEDRATSP